MAKDEAQTTSDPTQVDPTPPPGNDAQTTSVQGVQFAEQTAQESQGPCDIGRILDITVPVTVRLGQTVMSIDAVLAVANGSVIELDRLASDPVDILVRDKLIAQGEVVVVDENFGVRITSILDAKERVTDSASF